MGEGEVFDAQGVRRPTAEALETAGLEAVELQEKEGLALINGTDGMLGMLCMAIHDLRELVKVADITASMSIEALLGTDAVLAPELQALRPQVGQAASARNMMRVLAGSPIAASHAGDGAPHVQAAYSLRCAPQVAGGVRDTLDHAAVVAERELASAIDNPVVLPDGRVESNGNFHGAPVAYVLDFLAIVTADLASIAERRTDRMLDPCRLAAPASVDSIPSSAMQEDHVSMGWSAARKLRRSVDGLAHVLAIELLSAARALDLRAPLAPAAATQAVIVLLRQHVEGIGADRWLAPEIQKAYELIADGSVLAATQAVIGELE